MAESLGDAVASGEDRKALTALRDHLAHELEHGIRCKECGGGLASPSAPLAKQLRDTLSALASLPGTKGSVSDDLKAKRAARQAGVAKRAARAEQRRTGGDRTSR